MHAYTRDDERPLTPPRLRGPAVGRIGFSQGALWLAIGMLLAVSPVAVSAASYPEIDLDGNVILPFQGKLFKVDPDTGEHSELFPSLAPYGVSIDVDTSAGLLAVLSRFLRIIDMETGDLVTFDPSCYRPPNGGPCQELLPQSLEIDIVRNRVVLLSVGRARRLYSIDLQSGEIQILLDFEPSPVDDCLDRIWNGLELDTVSNVAYISYRHGSWLQGCPRPRQDSGGILRVDLEAGTQTVLSDYQTGAGVARVNQYGEPEPFSSPAGMALSALTLGGLIVADEQSVIAVNTANGDRTRLSSNGNGATLDRIGEGPPLRRLRGITYDQFNNRAFVTDDILRALISVDLDTGDRRIIFDESSLAPVDTDGDSLFDGDDNCPYVWNPDQENANAAEEAAGSERGDACECGDVSNDGFIDASDARLLQEMLAGLIPGVPAPEKCGTRGIPEDCSIRDVAAIRRWLSGADTERLSGCSASTPDSTSATLYSNPGDARIASRVDAAGNRTSLFGTKAPDGSTTSLTSLRLKGAGPLSPAYDVQFSQIIEPDGSIWIIASTGHSVEIRREGGHAVSIRTSDPSGRSWLQQSPLQPTQLTSLAASASAHSPGLTSQPSGTLAPGSIGTGDLSVVACNEPIGEIIPSPFLVSATGVMCLVGPSGECIELHEVVPARIAGGSFSFSYPRSPSIPVQPEQICSAVADLYLGLLCGQIAEVAAIFACGLPTQLKPFCVILTPLISSLCSAGADAGAGNLDACPTEGVEAVVDVFEPMQDAFGVRFTFGASSPGLGRGVTTNPLTYPVPLRDGIQEFVRLDTGGRELFLVSAPGQPEAVSGYTLQATGGCALGPRTVRFEVRGRSGIVHTDSIVVGTGSDPSFELTTQVPPDMESEEHRVLVTLENGDRVLETRHLTLYFDGICGDMVQSASEECDDGNRVSGDGCSSDCLEEEGEDCPDEDGDGYCDRCPSSICDERGETWFGYLCDCNPNCDGDPCRDYTSPDSLIPECRPSECRTPP